MNKHNKKNKDSNTENILVVARGHGGGRMGKIDERDLEVQTSRYKISHGDEKHSIGNMVKQYCSNWVWWLMVTTHRGEHFLMYRDVQSICTP